MIHAEKNIRAFLAILPSEPVLEAVAREQEKLKREMTGQINWTKSGGRHLTLKFFEAVSAADVSHIGAVAEKHAAGFAPFPLIVETLGVFPNRRKPRVLWSGVAGSIGELMALQGALDEDFEALGFPRENRPYHPHLTLARIKTLQHADGIDAVLGRHEHFRAGEFVCRELILFQSRLTPQGAFYNKLAVFPLIDR